VEEQTSSEPGGRSFGQPGAGDAPAQSTQQQPASQTKRWFFHFEIGIKKTVRAVPERSTDLRAAQPADRSGGAVPQMRMLGAVGGPAPGLAMAMPGLLPNQGGAGGAGNGSSSTSYAAYTRTDSGYTVSPPYPAGGPEE
jgi:hypothetical protein